MLVLQLAQLTQDMKLLTALQAPSLQRHSNPIATDATNKASLTPCQSLDVRPGANAKEAAAADGLAGDSLTGARSQAARSLDSGPAAGKAEASPVTNISTADPVISVSEGSAGVSRIEPVMLILCGVPGSGKSTFCAGLQASSTATWVR